MYLLSGGTFPESGAGQPYTLWSLPEALAAGLQNSDWFEQIHDVNFD
jgi:hypothetical protein